ncbi:CehA/McbA family metallohydrolase [Kribbella jiaozuonensis]|uniref:Histidinol phosphatase n=1 Tax=Kribbella jiaozuonensis TaxID=2575441 RepID=A0A4U3LZ48_9ACTN|nr:CehA/McbA family metallohydrolase [Kribbella jiaozuonensis]TKK81471.1 histidinol phosphatase [Kribbella jiaozuonensis]
MAVTSYKRRWTLDDRAESPWHSLPVDIPADCPGLLVTLTIPPVEGAVIDIGCEGAAGWRGWSGGARQTFAITPDAATPGYLPGELEPGTWWIVLGLHRIPVEGVELLVEATTGPVSNIPGLNEYADASAAIAVPPRPPRRTLPASSGLKWIAGDFHAHSLHSDGSTPVANLAALGVSAGLDVLAVTDHNTVAHHAELPALSNHFGIGLIPGQEVTTDTGHANAFGEIGVIDFRQPAATWVSEVARRGGLLSINHPLGGDCAWRHPLPEHPPLAEIWHSSWLDHTWGGPIAWWQAWGLEGTTPIGGSDWHNPTSFTPPGSPTTWIAVDANAEGPGELAAATLAGLSAGRTALSWSYTAPVLVRADDELIAIDAADTLVISPASTRHAVRSSAERIPATPGPHILVTHTGEFLATCG